MNSKNQKKYSKYRLKYLNLLNQTGGFHSIKDIDNIGISYKKEKSDTVHLLEGITSVKLNYKPFGTGLYKEYILYHTSREALENNMAKINDNKYSKLAIIHNEDENAIIVKGENFEILEDINKDKSNTDKLFTFNKANLDNIKKFKWFNNNKYPNRLENDRSYKIYSLFQSSSNRPVNDISLNIESHILKRFNELTTILNNFSEIKVIISGDSQSKKHNLLDHISDKGTDFYTKIDKYINLQIDKLTKKFSTRISIGQIGTDFNRNNIHVWATDKENWNLHDKKQITNSSIFTTQLEGVYGIFIGTTYNEVELFAGSSYIEDYFNNQYDEYY